MTRKGAMGVVVSVALVSGVACMGENTLGGSAGALFPLTVSRVEVLRNTDAFQVSYYVYDTTNVDLVARLTLDLSGLNFVPGKSYALTGQTDAGHQRATVTHLVTGEPLMVFPDVHSGNLNLSTGGLPGQTTTGDFSLSFINTTDFGGGRTLVGTFSSLARDAGYGPGL